MSRIGKTTSAGMWRYSNEFLIAGSVVKASAEGKYSNPAIFLFCRAMELSLKAFLLARGVSVSELRNPKRFGHNLNNLVREARRRKLGQYHKLTRQDIKAIDLLNAEYSSKHFEYIVTGTIKVPPIDGVELLVVQLVINLKTYCVNATYPGKIKIN